MLSEEEIKNIIYLANEYASESAELALEEMNGHSASALEFKIKERADAKKLLIQYLEGLK
ncbi:hypothetical protein AVV36_gp121 [Pectobacterium bacteriophage PM2]|uniref:Uncharacterized protein n=1 Tax=Pectobacterium bacteriophage PM2 TaxID=1429794 RepID=A0A0A0Q0N5_9CAUD|nr:hypothetical protein AVV36_gp121 [Pectobacterium bacteriophage PM2]AHY25083.1 hypothetical protein PM2_121 [Pectobacterium bacteriophage PM2]